MIEKDEGPAIAGDGRRRFLRMFGTGAIIASGVSLLAGCSEDDEGSVDTPSPTATLAPPPTPGPTYTATDADRLNFLLQVLYLEAAYFHRGVLGTSLNDTLTSGSGTLGVVRGGSQVTFDEAALSAAMRELAYGLTSHIRFLRTRIGTTVAAMPAIDISGDATGGFGAIATRPTATGTPAVFNPYASGVDFLIGAIALTSLTVTASYGVWRILQDRSLANDVAGMLSAHGYQDAVVRSALFQRGNITRPPLLPGEGTINVFDTVRRFSDTRDGFNARDLDAWLGWERDANISATDGSGIALQRSPEEVLNVLYANRSTVASGGFFPNGVNGVIRNSRGG